MEDSDKLSLEQIRAFLEASQEVGFVASDRAEVYGWVERTLRHHDYPKLARSAKGLLRRYVAKMTGLSRAQTARLIRGYQKGQEVKPKLIAGAASPRATHPPTSNSWPPSTTRTRS